MGYVAKRILDNSPIRIFEKTFDKKVKKLLIKASQEREIKRNNNITPSCFLFILRHLRLIGKAKSCFMKMKKLLLVS